MGADNGTDFLNSDFPMYAAGGVAFFCGYRAYVVSNLVCWEKRPMRRFGASTHPDLMHQGHDGMGCMVSSDTTHMMSVMNSECRFQLGARATSRRRAILLQRTFKLRSLGSDRQQNGGSKRERRVVARLAASVTYRFARVPQCFRMIGHAFFLSRKLRGLPATCSCKRMENTPHARIGIGYVLVAARSAFPSPCAYFTLVAPSWLWTRLCNAYTRAAWRWKSPLVLHFAATSTQRQVLVPEGSTDRWPMQHYCVPN